MKNLTSARPMLAALLVSTIGLSACTSIGYRCPLDPDEDSESQTACSSMQDAMLGAQKGTGGKTSALMDDKGRLVPRELLENKTAKPLAHQNSEPYRAKSGEPVFHQPKVFQVWTGAFVDAEGNLHDGHSSWFATPGRWAYGSVDKPSDIGSNTLRPALPDTRPAGRIVKTDKNGDEIKPPAQQQPQQQQANPQAQQQTQPQNAQQRDKAALQSLSKAANSAAANANAKSQPQPDVAAAQAPTANAVTAPAVGLGD